MLLGNPRFYIGLIDGAPAHIAYTKNSITVELFRDVRSAKRKFSEIASIRVEPVIKVIGLPPSEYAVLAAEFARLKRQVDQLSMSYRLKSFTEMISEWSSKRISNIKALWRRWIHG